MQSLIKATIITLAACLIVAGPATLDATATDFCTPDKPECVCGFSTVSHGTGEFEGYWCYEVNINWNSPRGLSHVNVLTSLQAQCACRPDLILFPDPAGTSQGFEDGDDDTPCDNTYDGEYNCNGDPSLSSPLDEIPAVKFEPNANCDDKIGSGTFTFYSLVGPMGNSETVHTMVLVNKNGNGECTGDLKGPMPAMECSVHTSRENWGSVKGRF